MDDRKTLFNEVFGESSSESGAGDDEGASLSNELSPIWERIDEVDGLWLCRDFLSPEEQSSLLSAVHADTLRLRICWLVAEGCFAEASHNQAMRFGDLPKWALELGQSIREVVVCNDISEPIDLDTWEELRETCILPLEILWREPFFDQLIVNVYQPGEGICAHVDLMRFEDGIAIVSLESACVMHFSQAEKASTTMTEGEPHPQPTTGRIPVYLAPGSLVVMSGEARYKWKHGINRQPGFQIWQGKEIDQERRTSVTLRKLRREE